MSRGWIGVDLDGTLAHYDEWRGYDHIGVPVPAMVERVKGWMKSGIEVRLFTARAQFFGLDKNGSERTPFPVIEAWCLEHLGRPIPITREKDRGMFELWDDRCVQVVRNTGERAVPLPPGPSPVERAALSLMKLYQKGADKDEPAKHAAKLKRAMARLRRELVKGNLITNNQ